MNTWPEDVLAPLRTGQFAVRLTGRPGAHVAANEAHECIINNDLKQILSRPTADYMRERTLHMSYRAQHLKRLFNKMSLSRRDGPGLERSTARGYKRTEQTVSVLGREGTLRGVATTSSCLTSPKMS
eukprot:jgi/Chlat1/507/Chrsp103S01102